MVHYHPNEEQDAKDTADYIKKVAPNAKVQTYAKDLRTEKACLEMVEEVKKWSGGKLDILYVIFIFFFSPIFSLFSPSLRPSATIPLTQSINYGYTLFVHSLYRMVGAIRYRTDSQGQQRRYPERGRKHREPRVRAVEARKFTSCPLIQNIC